MAEILARAVPVLHGDVGGGNGHGAGGMAGAKPKSNNFLQVPDLEGPRFGLVVFSLSTVETRYK